MLAEYFGIIRDFGPLVLGLLAVLALFLPSVRRNVGSKFFVSPPDQSDSGIERLLSELQRKIADLERQRGESLTDAATAEIRESIDREITNRIPSAVEEQISKLEEEGDELLSHLQNTANSKVSEYLSSLPLEEVASAALASHASVRAEQDLRVFSRNIERQLNNSHGVRTVMMNLFVAFNFLILGVFVVAPNALSEKAYASLLGVYVSLSAFIIFIYRSSNARVASMISIQEDQKKFENILVFLDRFKKGASFNNNDVEIIRLLAINRMERERGGEHPYEVVLKGVTNSTVLLRGGKVSSSKTGKDS